MTPPAMTGAIMLAKPLVMENMPVNCPMCSLGISGIRMAYGSVRTMDPPRPKMGRNRKVHSDVLHEEAEEQPAQVDPQPYPHHAQTAVLVGQEAARKAGDHVRDPHQAQKKRTRLGAEAPGSR